MQFLSEEFVSQWATIQRPLLGKATGLVVVKIDGAPEGKIAITAELENGLITNAYLGSGRGRDLELTIPYGLATDLFLHNADPAAEYMKGRLKMSGDMELWLELLPAWRERAVNGEQSDLVTKTAF
jgi:hypothetical protein